MNIGGVEPQVVEVGDFFEEEQTVMAAVKEREIWLHNNNNNVNINNNGHHHQDHHHYDEDDDLLAGVMDDAASLFYADDFPCLPDFSSCMSSSSSSSSPPAAAKVKNPLTCITSSSNTSSSDSAETPLLPPPQPAAAMALSSAASMEISQQTDRQGDCADGGDCVYQMDTFGSMELMESNEFFDPSSIFENEDNLLDELTQFDQVNNQPEVEGHASGGMMVLQEERQQQPPPQLAAEAVVTDEEMSSVFLEWLKMNKDSVSASDLRSVRLKKATIECAAKRLGGGKEGMKQLLKLILEWVQTSHLQKKRRMDYHVNNDNNDNLFMADQFHQDTTNPISDLNHQSSFGTEWISQRPAAASLAPPPFSQSVVGYGNNNNMVDPFSREFQAMDSTHSQFSVYNNNHPFGTTMAAYGGYANNQYPYQYLQGGAGLDRLGPLATKEARKKRMARQRRNVSHHHHQRQHNVQEQQQNQQNQTRDYCTGADTPAPPHANQPNWLYWPSPPVAASNGVGAASGAPVAQAEPPPSTMTGRNARDQSTAMQSEQNHQRSRVSLDKRQGWKSEKNLKFLLQKVLKQSDVGNLGRIVLPKKEAETHLPELEERDGISIAMEDIGTCRVWNMRYRYWPNNKSRMYLLENTGDFVRANGLQEGDFIVIYSDVKCGKYMIRGVKVRQAAGSKLETRKAAKSSHKVNLNGSDNPSSANKNHKKQ